MTLAEVDELIEELQHICRLEPDPQPGPRLLRDPNDDYIVHLAQHTGATHIISGDADLTDETLEPPAISPRQAIDTCHLD